MKIAILGAGKLGLSVLDALLDSDHDITLVDTNESKLTKLAQKYDVMTYLGDARTVEMFRQIDIRTYDFVLCCTSSDDVNILAASIAKKLGCRKSVARITEPEHMNQMDFICNNFDIDAVINPDMLITSEIYRYLIEKYSLSNGVFTTKRIALIEIEADRDSRLAGKPITAFRDILPNTLVAGISRHGKLLIPHGADMINPGDILYLVGEKDEMLKYAKMFIKRRRKSDARRVMIIGGGRTGYYLAGKLSDYGAMVKVIEQDEQRCTYLSNHLRNVMILHGSGTDIPLLEEENLDQMDAFISVTGFDEENLLLALTAKNHGVEDVISKISHENYEELITKLGIDIVLNPLDISTSTILRMINGSKRVLSTVLLQGQAELLELYIDDTMGMINTPLKDLDLPDYVLFAAINRGTATIIPGGNDMLKPGDHLIMVCLLSHIGFIEKLISPTHKLNLLK